VLHKWNPHVVQHLKRRDFRLDLRNTDDHFIQQGWVRFADQVVMAEVE
jgi:hypothetical protein